MTRIRKTPKNPRRQVSTVPAPETGKKTAKKKTTKKAASSDD